MPKFVTAKPDPFSGHRGLHSHAAFGEPHLESLKALATRSELPVADPRQPSLGQGSDRVSKDWESGYHPWSWSSDSESTT